MLIEEEEVGFCAAGPLSHLAAVLSIVVLMFVFPP